MKKGSISTIILILVFVVGLSLLLYPTVSDYWNSFHQSQAITEYAQQVANLYNVLYDQLWQEATDYNQRLRGKADRYDLSEEELAEYEALLNVSGNGIMGYVEIDKIDCSLPIYHGTDEAVLQVAVGHIQGSSLPVGGESTHSVLSGHRGLPSAKLFTDLDKLEEGDHFLLHILDDTLAYEVDAINVVEPDETELLSVVEGEDLVTLLTCTPYGVNTQRLLVRGHRVPYVPEEVAEEASDSLFGNSLHTNYIFWVVVGLALTGAFIGVLVLRDRYLQKHPERMRKRRRRRHAAKETGRESDGGQGREP